MHSPVTDNCWGDLAQDGKVRGIAQALAREAASGQGDAFGARFARLCEEFGRAF